VKALTDRHGWKRWTLLRLVRFAEAQYRANRLAWQEIYRRTGAVSWPIRGYCMDCARKTRGSRCAHCHRAWSRSRRAHLEALETEKEAT